MMSVVLVALVPCTVMAMYNTGLQANLTIQQLTEQGKIEISQAPEIRGDVLIRWGVDVLGLLGLGYDPAGLLDNLVHGALYFIPVYFVCFVVGK